MCVRQRLCVWLLTGLAWCGAVVAVGELANVYLRDGTVLRGEVTEANDVIILRNAAGERRIPRAEVLRVEPLAGTTSVAEEYRQRFDALSADDVAGHYALALWLRDQRRPDLVLTQCQYVLRLDPKHRDARLLAKWAEDELHRQGATSQPTSRPAGTALPVPPALSARDINRLKFSEWNPKLPPPENVRLRAFDRRNAPAVERRIEEALRAADASGAVYERYRRGNAAERVALVMEHTGTRLRDEVELQGDPTVFATYRDDVWPLVRRGCARAGCHGATGEAGAFRFPKGPAASEDVVYTSFAQLDRMKTADGALIDREALEFSLLLTYMLPGDETNRWHPLVSGRRLPPLVRGRSDPKFAAVTKWLESLAYPHPDYGLDYFGATSRPAAATRSGDATPATGPR